MENKIIKYIDFLNEATRGFRKDIEDADETPDTMNDLKK